MIRDLNGIVLTDSPDLTGDAESVHQELAGALTAAGLYPKEAAAMIETWRDSWFEEGMRIFTLCRAKRWMRCCRSRSRLRPAHRAGFRGTGRSAFTRNATYHRGGIGDRATQIHSGSMGGFCAHSATGF